MRSEVALPEVEGSLRRVIRGCFEVSDGDGGIPLHYRASQVSEADEIERVGISSIGSLVSPLHGLGIVFGDAFAIAKTHGEIDLSFGIACGGLALKV